MLNINILENEMIENIGEYHVCCVLLIDKSSSMSIANGELHSGLRLLLDEIKKDEVAAGRVELSMVTFDSDAREEVPFGPIDSFEIPNMECSGMTSMHKAVGIALDMIEKRKAEYKASGTPYYRPWIFMLTDGAPNDADNGEFKALIDAQNKKKVTFYGVGIGPQANKELLKSLNKDGLCFSASATEFRQAFRWLSTSLSTVSNSTPDTSVALENPNTNPAKYGGQIVCES